MAKKPKVNPVQRRLAAIKGLEFSDCLRFFDARATERDKEIASMVRTSDEGFERDNYITSEGDDNGSYVLGWRWVSFAGTKFDKEKDDVEEDGEE